MTERALQTKVLKKLHTWELTREGVWVNKSPSAWDASGISDILGCLPFSYSPYFVAIELKSPEIHDPFKALSVPQRRFLLKVQASGHLAIVANSWETIQACLEKRTGNMV